MLVFYLFSVVELRAAEVVVHLRCAEFCIFSVVHSCACLCCIFFVERVM